MVLSKRSRAWEIEAAQQAVLTAATVTQLRQSLAILIPALTGASLEVTADILGLSRHRIGGLRRQFRSGKNDPDGIAVKRGGRRRALMSVDDEIHFVAQWLSGARNGNGLAVATVHAAYERAVGRAVPKSTVYRLLARHGWLRDARREKQPI